MGSQPTHRTIRAMTIASWICSMLFISAARMSIGAPSHGGPIDVGMIKLLASPEKFDGKAISTIGLLSIGRLSEDDCLLLYEEDGRANRYHNMFALELSEDQRSQFRDLNHTYVRVVGTFHSKRPGSSKMNGGTIVRITKMSGWQPYRSPSPANQE